MITAIYVLNTLIAIVLVYAVLDPPGARGLAERLGLAPWLERLDADGTRRLLGFIGKLLLLAGILLVFSILGGHHSQAWYFPAGEAIFFGAMAWLGSVFGGKD